MDQTSTLELAFRIVFSFNLDCYLLDFKTYLVAFGLHISQCADLD